MAGKGVLPALTAGCFTTGRLYLSLLIRATELFEGTKQCRCRMQRAGSVPEDGFAVVLLWLRGLFEILCVVKTIPASPLAQFSGIFSCPTLGVGLATPAKRLLPMLLSSEYLIISKRQLRCQVVAQQ